MTKFYICPVPLEVNSVLRATEWAADTVWRAAAGAHLYRTGTMDRLTDVYRHVKERCSAAL